jgi:ribosomal protein S12 methylthiotransferase
LSKKKKTRDANPDSKGTYAFVSLGCPKNTVDSERMLGLLQLDGYELVQQPEGADFVVINTCGFIERARAESLGAIDEMLALKEAGKTKGVIVSGCLAERQQGDLLNERPGIDHLVGVFGREEITRVADRLVGHMEEQRTVFRPAPIRALSDRDRLRITPRHFAYLKISEGCDRLCTFCAIPKMRGKHASKSIEEVIAEAEQLAADGVRELIVVAQDTTYYGLDLYGETRLTELLKRLEEVRGIDWIRLMYFYPMYIDDELINTIAESRKILPYIDMPLQHASDTMLKRMARRVTRGETEELLDRLRSRIKGLALRTTFITGFPGETEADVDQLAEFIGKYKFERMGVFTYSLEGDTPAANLPNHVPNDVMEARRERLMQLQQQIAFDYNQRQIGQTREVILDQPVEGERGVWLGRSTADAPDVDGLVFVTADQHKLRAGDIVPVEIVATQEYDLVGVAAGKPRVRDNPARDSLVLLGKV